RGQRRWRSEVIRRREALFDRRYLGASDAPRARPGDDAQTVQASVVSAGGLFTTHTGVFRPGTSVSGSAAACPTRSRTCTRPSAGSKRLPGGFDLTQFSSRVTHQSSPIALTLRPPLPLFRRPQRGGAPRIASTKSPSGHVPTSTRWAPSSATSG